MAKIYELTRRDGRPLCAVLLDGVTDRELEAAFYRLLDYLSRAMLEAAGETGFRFDHAGGAVQASSSVAGAALEMIQGYIRRYKSWCRR